MWKTLRLLVLAQGVWFIPLHTTAALLPGLVESVRGVVGSVRDSRRSADHTLRLPISPGGFRYSTDQAFPVLFDQPVAIRSAPGDTNRLFVLEKPGRIAVMSNLAAPEREIFLDLSDRVFSEQECGMLGLAFHPAFATNGFFYVTYTTGSFWDVRLKLARFEVSNPDANSADAASETLLYSLSKGDPWHQGGDLHFGQDGYLYVSVGDGGFGSRNLQRIDRDFFAGILRLDVDKRPGSLPPNPHPGISSHYAIPPDNPFVGATRFNGVPVDPLRVRTEYFVVGLRNPWRFSVDPLTGDIYSNDTGADHREEVNLILGGVNYGWPFSEGSLRHSGVVDGAARPATLFPPLAEYGYEGGSASPQPGGLGKAITAGLLYRGSRLPGLEGAYVFSDFWTGDIGLVRPGNSDALRSVHSLQRELKRLGAAHRELAAGLRASQADWERSQREKERSWEALRPASAAATSGAILDLRPDGSTIVSGGSPWRDSYTITATTHLTNITAVRLEVLPDESLPWNGPGRGIGGNIVLSEIEIHAAPIHDPSASQQLQIGGASASYAQAGWDVQGTADGDHNTGWAIAPAVGLPHQAVFWFKHPPAFPTGTLLRITLHQLFGGQATIGRFRISATTSSPPPPADPNALATEILRLDPGSLTKSQQLALSSFHHSTHPTSRAIQAQIDRLRSNQIDLLNQNAVPIEWIAREPFIASFGIDPRTGDLLAADMLNGSLRRVTAQTEGLTALPERLEDTGIFSDLATLAPAPGVVPYVVNVPFWSDHASKRRWFHVPDPSHGIEFRLNGSWDTPLGTVWVKHFELPTSPGGSAATRHVETRVLIRHANGVHGATYRWDDAGRSATLVPEAGLDETIVASVGGVLRTQLWRFPSRSQCLQCHTPAGGHALGFTTAQLNREIAVGSGVQNQIQALDRAGFFFSSIPSPWVLPALAGEDDGSVSREYRVRSYLQANCAQCHQPGGSARSAWDARITTPLNQSGLIDVRPVHGAWPPEDRIVAPGSLERSVLWRRLNTLGAGHMPPLGTSLVNTGALLLVRDWILKDLPAYRTYEQWKTVAFRDHSSATGPGEDPDGDGLSNHAEYLIGSDPLEASPGLRLSIQRLEDRLLIRFPRPRNLSAQVEWTTNPADPRSWAALPLPGNAPIFPAAAHSAVLEEQVLVGAARFYRLGVRPP